MIDRRSPRKLPLLVLVSLSLLPLVPTAGCGNAGGGNDGPHVIYIDIDDHGLKALWQANAPTIQGWVKSGVLSYSKVDVPTHSNQSNMTLLTGDWPDADNVPGNGWLQRATYRAPWMFGPLIVGDYIFYDKNPLGSRVGSIYSRVEGAGEHSTYVGLLPPFEHDAGEVHFSLNMVMLESFLITPSLAQSILECQLGYPDAVFQSFHLDGPPAMNETLNHFNIEDAAATFRAAASGHGTVPRLMFVWDFIALDGDPTSADGADGPALVKVVEDYDAALGDLVQAVDASGYGDRTSYVLTLDHGKVDSQNQVVIEAQLAAAVGKYGAMYGITASDYTLLDEDGDAQIYAKVSGAGTDPTRSAEQQRIVHALVDILQTPGAITGLDTTRTVTWDGYDGTHTLRDYHADGPNSADILVFPADGWTLNSVDKSQTPGPFNPSVHPNPYGRHGGFSEDELYVPAIFSGPAFKHGQMIAEPIDHADVAPTVLAAIGLDPPANSQGYPVYAALAGDPGETVPLPADPSTSRDVVLAAAGYTGSPTLAGPPADGAIVVDVSDLSADDLLAPAGQPYGSSAPTPLPAFVASGASFEAYATWYRDFPVTEYQMITGTYPRGATYVPFAEDDPTQKTIPAKGLFQMPPAKDFIADQAGYDGWHSGAAVYGDETLFAAVKGLGLATALLGTPDFQASHLPASDLDITPASGKTLDQILAAGGAKQLVYLAVDGSGSGGALQAAADAVTMVQAALASSGLSKKLLVVLTSRGAAPIDATNADAHGPGSARHVPLVLVGPNVRAGVLLADPARPVDLPATLLFALGQPMRSDYADGTQADGGTDATTGQALPLPTGAYPGHAHVEAFDLKP